MDGRHGTVVPCAIGNAMNLIARTAIRGTSEDATDIYVGNKEKTGEKSPRLPQYPLLVSHASSAF